MRSTNPVLSRSDAFRVPTAELEQMYALPSRMSLDDVVMRTGGLLGIIAVTGTVGWLAKSPALLLLGLFGGLALGLVAAFQRMPHPAVVVGYAVFEGFFLGTLSWAFESQYPGIVAQAVLGTGACFVGVLVAYRTGIIKATPRFRKIIVSAMIGIAILYSINLLMALFGAGGVPVINESTPLGILFSIAVVTIAALSFVLDFELIEEGIRMGAPDRFAWKAAFGLVVGLVWLYIEMLRLLAKLRD